MMATLGPILLGGIDVQFSHQGLATATLWLTIFTTATGLVLLLMRYGRGPKGLWATATRWLHIVLGLAMAIYLMATYWIVPV